jgi:hypothetical protein
MSESIFIDTLLSESLYKNGFVKISPLSSDAVISLQKLYHSTKKNKNPINTHLYVSSRECNLNTSIEISTQIKNILLPFFNTIAYDFDLYGGAFLSKPQKDENEFSLHQDFTLVESKKDSMYAIWIALQDTTIYNGCMYIVDKSHNLFENYISATYNNHKIQRKNIIKEGIVNIELKAGEGIIFCDKVFHGSYPNKSTEERLAITARIANKGAQFVYYNKKSDAVASLYAISPEDLIAYFDEFQKGIIPNHIQLLKEVPYTHSPITEKALNKALTKVVFPNNETIFYKIKKYFFPPATNFINF